MGRFRCGARSSSSSNYLILFGVIMDHHLDSSPLPNSFRSPKELSPLIHDLNKKRKLLQYELGNSGLPWRRHKILHKDGSLGEPTNNEIGDADDDRLEVVSENDSNSLIGGSDNNVTFEVDSNTEGSSTRPFVQDQASTCNDNTVLKDAFYSAESRSTHEELEDENDEDAMLYSNDTATFLLASGRWGLGQDARLGTRKPTIDQEFEQYFSSLML